MKNAWKRTCAEDVMVRAIVVGRDDSLERALELCADESISGLPVIDGRQRAVGLITVSDMVHYLADSERRGRTGAGPHDHLRWEQGSAAHSLQEEEEDLLRMTSVSDVMTEEAVSVDRRVGLGRVAQLMSERRVHRVLVTADGRLVGLISALDLILALRSKKELAPKEGLGTDESKRRA